MKRAHLSALVFLLRLNVPEVTDAQVDAIVGARVNWRYRARRFGS